MKSGGSWGRVVSIVAGFATMLMPGGAIAQSVAPSAAPAEWIRYAEASTATISAWLGEEAEGPVRLRAYLNVAQADGSAPVEIRISLWIRPDGTIDRVSFAPFADAQANTDLRNMIVDRGLGTPPSNMLLPMRIAVQLKPTEKKAE
eukprot:Opistho-2@39084